MGATINQFITGTASAVSSLNVLFSSAVSSGQSMTVLTGMFSNPGVLNTVVDNVNAGAAFTARVNSTMSNASDTQAHLLMHDKLNLSSGAAASTYRVSVNLTNTVNISVYAATWDGGPFTFGSTASANGTSSGPQAGSQTASSTPTLFVCGAIHNGSGTLFNSTVGAGGPQTYSTTVNPTNSNQVLNVIYSTNSSLTQNPMHSMNVSTRWLAAGVVYMGLGSGGGATAVVNPWQMCMTGIQDKVY